MEKLMAELRGRLQVVGDDYLTITKEREDGDIEITDLHEWLRGWAGERVRLTIEKVQ